MKNLFVVLLVLLVQTTIVKADSFTMDRNGRSYTCTSDDSQKNCQLLPGRSECDDWRVTGTECIKFPSTGQGHLNDVYTRTCKQFDGCEIYLGSYLDKKLYDRFLACNLN